MKEKDLRQWHRKTGIILVLLMILQAGTGLVLTLEESLETVPASAQEYENHHGGEDDHDEGHSGQQYVSDAVSGEKSHEHDHGGGIMTVLSSIHHQGGVLGSAYRLITGLGIIWMAGTGGLMYFRLKARQKNR